MEGGNYMTTIPVPQTQDEILGFCKVVVQQINGKQSHNVRAHSGSTDNKVDIHRGFLRNTEDNSELELVLEGNYNDNTKYEWVARMSQIRVREFGHRGFILLANGQPSLLLYLQH